MTPVKGEPLGVVCNWPPALEAALQRWGTTQAKCPCLTALDVTGNKRVIFPPVCHSSFIDEQLKHEEEEGLVSRVGVLWLYFKESLVRIVFVNLNNLCLQIE